MNSLLPAPKRTVRQKGAYTKNSKENEIMESKTSETIQTHEQAHIDSRETECDQEDDDEELFTFQQNVPLSNNSLKRSAILDVEALRLQNNQEEMRQSEDEEDECHEEEAVDSTLEHNNSVFKKTSRDFDSMSSSAVQFGSMKEIRQMDQLDMDEEALRTRLIGEEAAASLLNPSLIMSNKGKLAQKPTGVAKAKNHVSALVYQVAQNERKIHEYHSSAKASQQETKSKYGF